MSEIEEIGEIGARSCREPILTSEERAERIRAAVQEILQRRATVYRALAKGCEDQTRAND